MPARVDAVTLEARHRGENSAADRGGSYPPVHACHDDPGVRFWAWPRCFSVIEDEIHKVGADMHRGAAPDRFVFPYDARVIVVDDGSADGTADRLRERWPGVRIGCSERSRNFAQASNRRVAAIGAGISFRDSIALRRGVYGERAE